MNEGYEDILMKTRCNVDSASFTPGAVDDHVLDTSWLEIIDIWTVSENQTYPLERTSVYDILQRRRATGASSPTRYYALAGHDRLLFWPAPAADDTFHIYYVPRPTALSASGNSPTDVPSQHHKVILNYVLAQAADYDDDATSGMGDKYRALYELGVRELRQDMRRRGGTRLGAARVGRRSVNLRVHPAQDI